jgi:uridine kinase
MVAENDLGPLLVAPSSYLELRTSIRGALGFPNERRGLLIGIDGVDGSGKSSVASWLSWQLEMPAVHLDIYIVEESDQITWKFDDIARALDGAQKAQRQSKRPVIVESVLLLHVLEKLGRQPDFHVFVEKDQHTPCLRNQLNSYFEQYKPQEKANCVLKWSSVEYDTRVARAHLTMHDD